MSQITLKEKRMIELKYQTLKKDLRVVEKMIDNGYQEFKNNPGIISSVVHHIQKGFKTYDSMRRHMRNEHGYKGGQNKGIFSMFAAVTIRPKLRKKIELRTVRHFIMNFNFYLKKGT